MLIHPVLAENSLFKLVGEIFHPLFELFGLILAGLYAVWPNYGFAITGLTVGLTLTVIHLISIPIDNTSVNPARSLATAIFQGSWALKQLWVFIVFPLVGGILGAAVWRVLRPESDEETLEESEEVAPAPYGKREMPGQ